MSFHSWKLFTFSSYSNIKFIKIFIITISLRGETAKIEVDIRNWLDVTQEKRREENLATYG